MGKNIYDFASEKSNQQPQNTPNNHEKYSDMEKKIGQYQKLSEKELSDEVTAQVEKLKKQGKWNKNKVEQLMGQVAPFLSAQQVLSLKNIIEGLE